MHVCLVTPATPGSARGNGVTAERWASILSTLGHSVEVCGEYDAQEADLLVVLHARRGAASLRRFKGRDPSRPAVLALTGTDLYPALTDLDRPVLELADRLVVLQPLGLAQLPEDLATRAAVIVQSAAALPEKVLPAAGRFDAAVLSNLRRVKDPLLAARAARRLSAASTVRIRHAGAALDQRTLRVVERESLRNPRFEWLGELSRRESQRLLAGSRLLVLTSRHEGGANVISEAIAAGVPVLGTRIPGTVGLLGADYPGYFPVGDARALASLLERAERDGELYEELGRRCAALRPLVAPERERAAWETLLKQLAAVRPPAQRAIAEAGGSGRV